MIRPVPCEYLPRLRQSSVHLRTRIQVVRVARADTETRYEDDSQSVISVVKVQR